MSRLLLLLLLLLPSVAIAAEEPAQFPVERWRPALDRHGLLDVETGLMLQPWESDFSFSVGYAHEPLAIYRRDGDELVRAGALVGPRVGANATATLGLFTWLQVGVDVPVVVFQARGALPADLPLSPLAIGGLGDIRLAPKLQFLNTDDGGFVNLALLTSVTAPTSLPQGEYLGEKFFTLAPEIIVSKNVFGTRAAANLGYRTRSLTKSGGVVVGHEAFYRLGLGLPLESVGVPLPVEVDVTVHGAVAVIPEPGANTPLEALIGVKSDVSERVQLFAGAGAGVIGAPTVPDFRVIAGLRGSFDLADDDHDGADDENDKCPDEEEDADGIQDDDGCPEADADHDDIRDEADQCPLEREDRDDFEDQDGCPDPDNDGDGFPDTTDKCPRAPGMAEYGGCRPPDTDGDRLADHLDKCPTVKALGTLDGCLPASADPVVQKALERIDEIVHKLNFATDSAELTPASESSLHAVANLLAENPQIARVRVEGHTDDTGFHAYNKKLSLRRAEAVRAALIKEGIHSERLEAVGFGASRPLVDGKTPEARAQNRRVEFIPVYEEATAVDPSTPPPPASPAPAETK